MISLKPVDGARKVTSPAQVRRVPRYRLLAQLLSCVLAFELFFHIWRPSGYTNCSGRLGGSESQLRERRVWLYTLFGTDHHGWKLFPHFMEHYISLGISPDNFIVLVHHDPDKYESHGLVEVLRLCEQWGVACRMWQGTFSAEEHYHHHIRTLQSTIVNPEDWVIVADSDEFQAWDQQIPSALAEAEATGATYVQGMLVDRLACTGAIIDLPTYTPIASRTLHADFPLSCHVVRNLYNGWDQKIVAFKAFLRSGRGNHKIIPPSIAKRYFRPCVPGTTCLRPREVFKEVDLFKNTPYSKYYRNYVNSRSVSSSSKLWDAVQYDQVMKIDHFKWHAGVLNSMRDRMELYRGDCKFGSETLCKPNYPSWKEAAVTYNTLKDSMRLDISGMECYDQQRCIDAENSGFHDFES